MARYDYKCVSCGLLEIEHEMKADPHTVCPECGDEGLTKLISLPTIIHKGRQVNQYNDVKGAKFWRDADGNRHRVTSADGGAKSPTVSSKRKRTDQEVAAIKKRDKKRAKKQRTAASYDRFKQRIKRL